LHFEGFWVDKRLFKSLVLEKLEGLLVGDCDCCLMIVVVVDDGEKMKRAMDTYIPFRVSGAM